jgi:S1-C subfamily serine protease
MNTTKKCLQIIVGIVLITLFDSIIVYTQNADPLNATNDVSQIVESITPATYRINVSAENGEHRDGTAFAIHPDGFLISCNHGLNKEDTIIVFDGNNNAIPVNLVSYIPQYDLAVLKTKESKQDYHFAHITNDFVDNYDSLFFALGNLQNEGLLLLRGYLAKKQLGGNPIFVIDNFLTFSMPSDVGCSGAPIFDHHGYVVGVSCGILNGTTSLCQAIPSYYIEKACAETTNLNSFTGKTLGLTIKTKKDGVFVSSIKPDSPAASLDIVPNDRILSVGKWSVHNGVDYYLSELALGISDISKKSIPVKIFSNSQNKEVTLNIPFSPDIYRINETHGQLESGCPFLFFQKDNNSSGQIITEGWTKSLNISCTDQKHHIIFQGFLKLPHDGSYCFYLNVRGTGTFSLNDSFTIKNTILHPSMQVMKRGYFSKGYHKFVLDMELHQSSTDPFLFVDEGEKKMSVPSEWLYGIKSDTNINQN